MSQTYQTLHSSGRGDGGRSAVLARVLFRRLHHVIVSLRLPTAALVCSLVQAEALDGMLPLVRSAARKGECVAGTNCSRGLRASMTAVFLVVHRWTCRVSNTGAEFCGRWERTVWEMASEMRQCTPIRYSRCRNRDECCLHDNGCYHDNHHYNVIITNIIVISNSHYYTIMSLSPT